jgi:peptidyl-prolyl cis-trans isomerase C
VAQQLEMARQSVLAGVFVQNVSKKTPISEGQIKQEYDRVNSTLEKKEYNVRHIVLATEAEAKAIIAQLGKNESFEKLAEKSKDSTSAARGGSLGWLKSSALFPALGNAIIKLPKGGYTKEPVQTQYGWHVVKVDDERAIALPSLAEVKPQLQQRLQQQAVQKAVTDLRAKTRVE